MTTQPDRWGQPLEQAQSRVVVGRWAARRMSRRFADVGVRITPARLRELQLGAPLVSRESVDFAFALAATELKNEQRLARSRRNRQRVVKALLVAGLMLAALNLLICMGYLFISLALREPAM